MSNPENMELPKLFYVLMTLIILCMGFCLGCVTVGATDNTRELERAKAVKAGVAYYKLNQETGVIDFEYLDLPGYTAFILGASRAPKAIE